jgi:hypothetical protein
MVTVPPRDFDDRYGDSDLGERCPRRRGEPRACERSGTVGNADPGNNGGPSARAEPSLAHAVEDLATLTGVGAKEPPTMVTVPPQGLSTIDTAITIADSDAPGPRSPRACERSTAAVGECGPGQQWLGASVP